MPEAFQHELRRVFRVNGIAARSTYTDGNVIREFDALKFLTKQGMIGDWKCFAKYGCREEPISPLFDFSVSSALNSVNMAEMRANCD